jgi:plasmid replication initiation protein
MKTVNIEDSKNNIVKKHNDLIHKARYSLSENGIKAVSTLISMIKKDDEDFQEYHININDFKELINSNSKEVAKYVDIMTDELMSKPFKIDNCKFNWCYMAKYKEGENNVMFKIAPELKPYLLELQQNFTQYNIKNILVLKSAYVIRLYEYIISKYTEYMNYNKSAKSFTFEIEIEDIRELFEIPESQLYADVKRHIIDKAVKQFKEKTNIQFTYEEQKIGRKVVRLKIKVSDNNKGSNDIFASRRAFVEYIRKTYKPDASKNLFPIVISTKTGDVKVNLNGEIYISSDEIKTLDSTQADKLWNWLFEIVKEKPELLKNPNEKNLLN